MAINLDKMKQDRAKRQGGGELFDAPEGDTNVLVLALPRPEDDLPHIETRMHYGLGPKAKASAMCLEPSDNGLLLRPAFLEQLEALGKDLSGGCEVCERLDRGESVSGDPEQNGKGISRWMWLIMPISTRGDARQAFKAWPSEEVKGFFVGYRVWDAMSDLFGSCGDITDLDSAILARIIRVGKKMSTNWQVQPDIDTTRKPMKISKTTRELIAESTKPGAEYDPLRILASLSRTREDVIKIFERGGGPKPADGEYETPAEPTEPAAAPAGGFKPPAAKGKSQAQVPATTSAVAAAPATKAPAAKALAKAEPAAAPAKGTAAGNAKLKALIAERGQPPSCYNVDPDAEVQMCIDCNWKVECFSFCGVELPAEVPAAEPEAEAEAEGIAVEECVIGETYMVNDAPAVYKGPAKGSFYFTGGDGKPVKVPPGTSVTGLIEEEAPAEDAPADEDPKMAELEKELAARKAKKAAAPPKK